MYNGRVINYAILSCIDNNEIDIGCWNFPLKYGKLGDISFKNKEAQQIVEGLDQLLLVCLDRYPNELDEK